MIEETRLPKSILDKSVYSGKEFIAKQTTPNKKKLLITLAIGNGGYHFVDSFVH
jgi:hypothetical protein